jgi:hypothetical protein
LWRRKRKKNKKKIKSEPQLKILETPPKIYLISRDIMGSKQVDVSYREITTLSLNQFNRSEDAMSTITSYRYVLFALVTCAVVGVGRDERFAGRRVVAGVDRMPGKRLRTALSLKFVFLGWAFKAGANR